MNNAGAIKVSMPVVQPADLWQESGRWEQYGPELLRFVDRGEHPSLLGPTREEVITDLIRNELSSYKQLPLEPLSDPDQVPRRSASAFRRHAFPANS